MSKKLKTHNGLSASILASHPHSSSSSGKKQGNNRSDDYDRTEVRITNENGHKYDCSGGNDEMLMSCNLSEDKCL